MTQEPGGNAAADAPPELHVVTHTHWDREWYHVAARFRQRLVTLIDQLLDSPPAGPFLLDGQSVALEDYLAVRPERAGELSSRMRQGRLEAGPWFVLPDELLPSGEALVRNLLAGRRVVRRLRADPPAVLYCPDSFGHPAALPALAAGFGCSLIILWRGYGGRAWPPGDTARWRAPSGEEALAWHLPPDGYEYGSSLPTDEREARDRWNRLRPDVEERTRLGVVLLTNGADHHAVQVGLDDALMSLAFVASPWRVVRSSLTRFASSLERRAANTRLPVVTGEARDSYGYTWTLQGTFATRAHQKRANARAERGLVRDAEPWLALARLRGASSGIHLSNAAWRELLLCHPHDTLCGCSIDEVARAFDVRVDDVQSQAQGLRHDAMHHLLETDPERFAALESTPRIVVRNRSAHPRSGLAEVTVELPLAPAPVGPGSANVSATRRRWGRIVIDGAASVHQELEREVDFARDERRLGYPRNLLVERRRLLVAVPVVPPLGMCTLGVRGGRQTEPLPQTAATSADGAIANDALRVRVVDGRVRLEATGVVIEDLIGFESVGDRGDLYTHSPMEGTRVMGALTGSKVTAAGPLRAELETRWKLHIPSRRLTRASGEPLRRPSSTVRCRVRLQLDAGSPFVRVLVDGENTATDHRLRLIVRSGLTSPAVYADAAFAIVRREASQPREPVPDSQVALEARPPTAPLHRYVSCFGADRGMTLVSDGLAEYEASVDGDICVTLVRAVGELSRRDLPERPGFAGWPSATPAAQCFGAFAAELALMPHAARSPFTIDAIERAADDVLLPLIGESWRSEKAPRERVEGIALEGRGLSFTAFTEAQDGEHVVARCVNLLDEPVTGAWIVSHVKHALRARLDETPVGALSVREGRVEFIAPPRGIVTVLLR